MRTHGLWQCSNIYAYIEENIPSLKNNVSIFVHGGRKPWRVSYSRNVTRPLLHISYEWEDDIACTDPTWIWETEPYFPIDGALHIYNFHPIHVVLNTETLKRYDNLQCICPHLPNLTPKTAYQFVNAQKTGIRDFLKNCL